MKKKISLFLAAAMMLTLFAGCTKLVGAGCSLIIGINYVCAFSRKKKTPAGFR